MILSEVIQALAQGSETEIRCSNAEQYALYFRFLRQAVLDRHIPHYKVIGVSYVRSDKSLKRLRSFVNIEGNDSVGESFPELMLNLQDKIFLLKGEQSGRVVPVTCTASTGTLTAPQAEFRNEAQSSVQYLYTNKSVFTVMNDIVIIQLHLQYGVKFHDMAATSKLLTKTVFPFYVDYSLQDYVRILPPMQGLRDNVIRLRYSNGMTKSIFLSILNEWYDSLQVRDFGQEEKLWLQRSEH